MNDISDMVKPEEQRVIDDLPGDTIKVAFAMQEAIHDGLEAAGATDVKLEEVTNQVMKRLWPMTAFLPSITELTLHARNMADDRHTGAVHIKWRSPGEPIEDKYGEVVDWKGPARWAVTRYSECFDKDLKVMHERRPSGRTDEFMERYRHNFGDAVRIAEQIVTRIEDAVDELDRRREEFVKAGHKLGDKGTPMWREPRWEDGTIHDEEDDGE